MPRYFNPYTDFGFKKLFGEEANKDLLIDFLNQLLPSQHQIAKLRFRNVERLPDIALERKAIFDIHCISTTGKRFIVEMQKSRMAFFKDRALFYVTFPIREQSRKGEWDFQLEPIYFVAILDFEYDENVLQRKFRRDIALRDIDGELFSDKLHFKFLQMPLFNKQEHELTTHFDKWLYFLKNLESFEHIPAILDEPIFQKAFHTAALANLNKKQHAAYEKARLDYLTMKAVIDTAHDEGMEEGFAKGREEGREEGRVEGEMKGQARLILNMLQRGANLKQIANFTGMTIEQIEDLRRLV